MALICSLICCAASIAADQSKEVSFDIPSDSAVKALKQFSAQSGLQLLYSNADLAGVTTNQVKGSLSVTAALDRLLEGTPLVASRDSKNGAVAVFRQTPEKSDPNAQRVAQNSSDRPNESQKPEMGVIKLDSFEVMGSKLLNMDKPRSRDDAQPYVVFDQQAISNSGATNLEDFFKQRLTMNAQAFNGNQSAAATGNSSQINLRGLGTAQTLILIDGHRTASFVSQGVTGQADLNGLPLGAIERIEVLPTTASGIYGGGATGGVINVILRQNYVGAELTTVYGNTFDSDRASKNISLNAGLTLEGGKTNILISAHWSKSDSLLVGNRDLEQNGLAAIASNNPAAIYGSALPRIGATPNIRSVSGANLILKSGVPLNSPITFVPAGYSGSAADAGAALVANAGKYNLALAPGSRQFLGGADEGLLPETDITSIAATFRRQFTPNVQGFVEAFASNNISHLPYTSFGFAGFVVSAAAPNNPFTQDVRVAFPTASANSEIDGTSKNRRITSGILLKLPHRWNGEMDYTWDQARDGFFFSNAASASLTSAVSGGSINVLRDTLVFPVDLGQYLVTDNTRRQTPITSTLHDVTVRAAGPVLNLPAGEMNISILAEERYEPVGEGISFGNFVPHRSQTVQSAYLETQVPLVGNEQKIPAVTELSLQLAGRFDRYKVDGVAATTAPGATVQRATSRQDSTNPTVGLRWEAAGGVMLRGSFGTGFLPPTTNQLAPSALAVQSAGLVDPRRGNTLTGAATLVNGGNSALQPEKSKSWSTGVVYEPVFASGLRLSLDYTRIKKTNAITTLTAQQIINNELTLPGRVERAAAPPGDPYGVGPITLINNTLINLASAEVEAYDLAADYAVKTGSDLTLGLFGVATWTTHYRTQVLASDPVVDSVGITRNFPLKFKANAGLTWQYRHLKGGWTTRYFNSYQVALNPATTGAATVANQGGLRVPSQVYHDVFVGYAFDRGNARLNRILADAEIRIGVNNVFNTKPPFDAGDSSYYYSPYGDALLANYYVSLSKKF